MDHEKWLAAQSEWENPANWRPVGHYVAPRDPRVWVRKQNRALGWTLNFAHRSSWLWLAVVLGVPLLIAVVAARG